MIDGRVRTRVAIARHDDHRFMGFSLLRELFGETSWIELLFLSVSGKKPRSEFVAVLDSLAVALAAADGRIWPLKIGRIVASYGSPLAGVAATVVALQDLNKVGPWISGQCAQLLLEAHQAEQAASLETFVTGEGKRRFPGWGVPLRARDERFLRLAEFVEQSGLANREFWTLHRKLTELLASKHSLQPNIGSGFAAVLLDAGMTDPKHISVFMCLLVVHLAGAHAVECAREQYPSYRRLALSSVSYEGIAQRSLPSDWDE